MPDALPPTDLPDPAECPLCAQPNRCVPAQEGGAAATCWCMSAHIANAVLAAVPVSERGQRCICPRCAGVDTAG